MISKRINRGFLGLIIVCGILQAEAAVAIELDDLDVTITVIESETEDARAITQEISLPPRADMAGPRGDGNETELDATDTSSRSSDEQRDDANDDAREELRDTDIRDSDSAAAMEDTRDDIQDREDDSQETQDISGESQNVADDTRDSVNDAHEESSGGEVQEEIDEPEEPSSH